jgi:hypothetical protein
MRGYYKGMKPAVVATYEAKPSTWDFATHLDVVGSLYNCALMNPESNRTGYEVIKLLLAVHNYPKLAKKMVIENDKKVNVRGATGRIEYGFSTHDKLRRALVEAVISAVELKKVDIWDERLINQFKTFVRDDGGRPGASYGTHDDLVIAFGIALVTMEYIGFYEAQHRTPINGVAFFASNNEWYTSKGQAASIRDMRQNSVVEELKERYRKQGIPEIYLEDYVQRSLETGDYLKAV